MSKIGEPLILFSPKLPRLSKSESQVLKLLVEAGKLIVPIYELQENHKLEGANFYPQDTTKKEIEEAAKKDPILLSPYSIVERVGGKLVATPYHEKYAKYLLPIAEKLQEASEASDDKEFAKLLLMQAQALLDGNYNSITIHRMAMKPHLLDINIGPIERYDDKLFFVKASYQAWVGVMDVEQTKRINEYKSAILSARRESMMPSEKVDYYDKVKVRIDDTLLFSGLIARTMFVGVNLPNDPNLMEKHGSEITIFKQANEHRLKNEVLLTFNQIFSPGFKKEYSVRDLEIAGLSLIALHELAHTYLRYRNSEKNLRDLFPIIDELAAYVMGIKVCGSLLLKDVVTQQQLTAIMVNFIARSYYLVRYERTNRSRLHYTIGASVFLNFLMESGAIHTVGGISVPNFMKVFVSIDKLASLLEKLLSTGTREDAEVFIKRYNNIEKVPKFR